MLLIDEFVRQLLWWHQANSRAYPWRDTRDPYEILIAELLLQRTRAEQVLPVYRRFLARYPRPDRAPDKQVLAQLLAPLGLPTRVDRIHAILRRLHDECGGEIPRDPGQLSRLLGPGSTYVRDALLVMAYGERVVPVDRTVARLLGRFFLGYVPQPGRPHSNREILELAAAIAVKGSPRNLFLALVDFAALVCKPRPVCTNCIVKPGCCAFSREEQGGQRGWSVRNLMKHA